MEKLGNQQKKRRIINLCLVGACLLIALCVVIVDYVGNLKSDATLTVEQAQSQLEEALKELPSATGFCAKDVVENTKIEVLSVESGSDRNFVVKVRYETLNVKAMYEANQTLIFEKAWKEAEAIKSTSANGSYNATQLQGKMIPYLRELLQDEQWRISGETEVSFYDTREEALAIHLSDDALNQLLGGLVAVKDDIKGTMEIKVGSSTVSIASDNTFRNGINQCFGLDNYDSEKPDTSSPLTQVWNDLVKDFHKNFIEKDRWLYLLEGVGNTLALTGLSLLLGIVLGLGTAIVRVVYEKTDKLYYLDRIAKTYVSIIRGTPLMVQLLIIYFVLLLPIGIEKFPAAVLCFGLNSGAYVSEIIRGGIMSVDEGQTEAGRSLGFGYGATMLHIVMPQAFKAVLPALCNEFITLLKETSVAFYIGVADLTRAGIKIRSITYSNFMPLVAVALIYLVLVLILTKLVGILERRLRKSER